MCQRPGPDRQPVDVDAREVDAEDLDAGPDVDVDLEVELRDDVDDRVELEAALERRDADVAQTRIDEPPCTVAEVTAK